MKAVHNAVIPEVQINFFGAISINEIRALKFQSRHGFKNLSDEVF